jgi:hypothetical protein
MQYSNHPSAKLVHSLTCTAARDKTKNGWKGRRLLLDLANLPDPIEPDHLRRLATHYPEVFDFIVYDEAGFKELVGLLARFLRLAWRASNARERNWHLFTVRQEYVRGMLGTRVMVTRDGRGGRDAARKVIPLVPPKTPLDLAVHHAQTRLSDKMAVCVRGKACDSPYFFLRRKGQKYCGTDCRAIVLQERSNAWWAQHGKRWRAEQRKRKGTAKPCVG